jgi:hypothetical protein
LNPPFNTYWPELETALIEISKVKQPHIAKRSIEDIAEETLNIVRDFQMQLVHSLGRPIMTTTQTLSMPDNLTMFRDLLTLQDDPMTGETVNTGRLYSRGRLGPPPTIPPRRKERFSIRSDKPKVE